MHYRTLLPLVVAVSLLGLDALATDWSDRLFYDYWHPNAVRQSCEAPLKKNKRKTKAEKQDETAATVSGEPVRDDSQGFGPDDVVSEFPERSRVDNGPDGVGGTEFGGFGGGGSDYGSFGGDGYGGDF